MLFEPTECPYYLISRTSLQITSALKKGFAAAGVDGVRPAYLGVLLSLWREDGLKMVELGRRAGLEPSTMTGLLDRMQRDNLVVRAADPHDRRAHRIQLTDRARKMESPVLAVTQQILSKIFKGVPQKELDRAMNTMRVVLTNLKEETSP